jgi:O-antigen/teichoic acid export membrane protein
MPEGSPAAGSGRPALRPFTGASVALLSRLGVRLLGLVFLVLLAHRQSTRTFASYAYLLVLASTVSVITDAGAGLVANREVASGHLDLATAYRAAAPIQLVTSVLAGLGVVLVGTVLPGPVLSHWALLWTAAFIFMNGLFDGQTELLRGAGRPWLEAALQLAVGALQLALGLVIVLGGYGLAALMAVLALKQLLAVAVAQLWLPAPWGGGSGLWRRFLRRGLWLGAATTLGVIAGRSAQLALGNLGDTSQVAQFAVASRYLELATMACGTAAFGLLPSMAQRARHAGAPQRSFQRRLIALTLIASVALAALLTPVTPWLTVTVFGSRYRGAVPASQLFVAFLPVIALTNIAWYALVAERLERLVALAALAGAVVAVVAIAWIALDPTPVAAAGATMAGLGASAALALGFLARSQRRSAHPAPVDVEPEFVREENTLAEPLRSTPERLGATAQVALPRVEGR